MELHPDWADIHRETLKQKLTSRCHNIGLRPGTIWQHEQVGHEPLPASPPNPNPHTQPHRPPAACRQLCGLRSRAPCYGEVLGKSRDRLNTGVVFDIHRFSFFLCFYFLSLTSRFLMSHPEQHLPLLITQGASDSYDLKRFTLTDTAKRLAMKRMSEMGNQMNKRLGTRRLYR